MTRREPQQQKPVLEVLADEHDAPAPDPFRTTTRSRAAHQRKSA